MMPYGEYAECPNCGKIAHGEEEICGDPQKLDLKA